MFIERKDFLLGSNGKLIETNKKKELPNILVNSIKIHFLNF